MLIAKQAIGFLINVDTFRATDCKRSQTGKSTTRSIALAVASPTFIVNNTDSGYLKKGTWGASTGTGINGNSTRASSNANAVATRNAPTLAPGYYSVAIWRVSASTDSTNARVTVVHNGIPEPVKTNNFATAATSFVELTAFFFSGAPGEFVRLSQVATVSTL